ncbi:uncharacterized protein PRCAT00001405001 [Priceomyces carsonii]|uniref:uncharacterized protein n=1 Tax=Priceomyces carsonii TaxID=28549 RepID=UPI002ED9F298|nr:unnamed protein product [Priceomyces carsonii]
MMGDMPSSEENATDRTNSMRLTFTNDFENVPVLFNGFFARTKSQAFGIFCLIFFTAFLFRTFIFIYIYVEEGAWKIATKLQNPKPKETVQFGFDDEKDPEVLCPNFAGPIYYKRSDDALSLSSSSPNSHILNNKQKVLWLLLFYTSWKEFERDFLRIILSFIIATLAYSLMLVVMTYVTCYFFATVLGLTCGEVWLKRLGRLLYSNGHMTANSEELLSEPKVLC